MTSSFVCYECGIVIDLILRQRNPSGIEPLPDGWEYVSGSAQRKDDGIIYAAHLPVCSAKCRQLLYGSATPPPEIAMCHAHASTATR